jgi:hypothetical protein
MFYCFAKQTLFSLITGCTAAMRLLKAEPRAKPWKILQVDLLSSTIPADSTLFVFISLIRWTDRVLRAAVERMSTEFVSNHNESQRSTVHDGMFR